MSCRRVSKPNKPNSPNNPYSPSNPLRSNRDQIYSPIPSQDNPNSPNNPDNPSNPICQQCMANGAVRERESIAIITLKKEKDELRKKLHKVTLITLIALIKVNLHL